VASDIRGIGDKEQKKNGVGRRTWISVKGYENPEESNSTYFGIICALTVGKICVARDETSRRTIEK